MHYNYSSFERIISRISFYGKRKCQFWNNKGKKRKKKKKKKKKKEKEEEEGEEWGDAIKRGTR